MDFKEFLDGCKNTCTDESCPMKQEVDWLTENVDILPDKIDGFEPAAEHIVQRLCDKIPTVLYLLMSDETAGCLIVHAIRDSIIYGYARGRREQIEIDRIEKIVND